MKMCWSFAMTLISFRFEAKLSSGAIIFWYLLYSRLILPHNRPTNTTKEHLLLIPCLYEILMVNWLKVRVWKFATSRLRSIAIDYGYKGSQCISMPFDSHSTCFTFKPKVLHPHGFLHLTSKPSTSPTMASPPVAQPLAAEVRQGNQASASHSSFQQLLTPEQKSMLWIWHEWNRVVSKPWTSIIFHKLTPKPELFVLFGHFGRDALTKPPFGVSWGRYKFTRYCIYLNV